MISLYFQHENSKTKLVFRSLVDTGSSICILSINTSDLLNCNINKNDSLSFQTADGNKTKSEGSTFLNVSSPRNPKTSWRIKFHVSSNLPFDAIIGIPFLDSTQIDLKKDTIVKTKVNKAITIPLEDVHESKSSEIYSIELFSPSVGNSDNSLKTQCFAASETEVKFDINPKLSKGQFQQVQRLLYSFRDIFTTNQADVQTFKNGDHLSFKPVMTSNTYSRKWHVPSIPDKLLDEFDQQFDKWMKAKIVEPQVEPTPFCSGFVPVRKADGGTRFCLDTRNVNCILEDESVALDKIEDIAQQSANFNFYSSMDIISFYLSFLMHEESRPLLTFIHPRTKATWRFTRSVFGLKGSASHTTRCLNLELNKLPFFGRFLRTYIDDLLLMSHSFDDHLEMLTELFTMLRACRVRLKHTKCKFFYPNIDIFGYNLSADGMKISDKRVRALLDIKPPRLKKQLVSHLSALSYFRNNFPIDRPLAKFSAGFKEIVSSKLESARVITWTPALTKLWSDMHSALSDAVIRNRLERNDDVIVLRSDSSESYYGWAVSVLRGKQEFLLTTGSRCWTDTARRWHITRKELMAILIAMREIRHLCHGRHLIIHTDNAYSAYTMAHPENVLIAEPSAISKAMYEVAGINFEIKRATNKGNREWAIIDGLSRSGEKSFISARNVHELLTAPDSAAWSFAAASDLRMEPMPLADLRLQAVLTDQKRFRHILDEIQTSEQYISSSKVSDKFQKVLLVALHRMGHIGRVRMVNILNALNLHWRGRNTLIEQICRQCSTCGTKKPSSKNLDIQQATTECNEPFEILSIDSNTTGQGSSVMQSTSANILRELFVDPQWNCSKS